MDQPAERMGWLHHIPAALIAGLICGLLAVMFSISAAALLFSSVLSEYIVVGIGICVFGTIVLNSFIAFFSSCPGIVSVTQEVTVVTLAVIATSIHARMFAAHSEAETLATIIVMIGLATAITGLALLLIGTLRLGRFIRFVPYPVTAGFLAGMGWLIVSGAMAVILDIPLDHLSISSLLAPENFTKWVPATIFAAIVYAVSQRNGSPLILPSAVIVSLILFHSGVAILDLSITELQHFGWLFTPPQDGRLLLPFQGNPLAMADWGIIWSETPKIVALVAITASALLFASSGIEVSLKRDVDLDRELRVAGIANIFTGAGGGAAGFQGLGLTLLAHQLGAPFRIVGLLVAGVCIAALFYGPMLLSFVPVPLLGGLLLWIGGSLIYEWLIAIRAQIPRFEHLTVLLVVIVMVTVGLIEGILVGVFAVTARFMFDFSRVDVIKYVITSGTCQNPNGNGDNSSSNYKDDNNRILALKLQGFIFFGNVYRLHHFILGQLGQECELNTRFVVLDCLDVTGIDSSAMRSLKKIRDLIEKKNGRLILSGLTQANSEKVSDLTRRGDNGQGIYRFVDTAQAIAWCEGSISTGLDDRTRRC